MSSKDFSRWGICTSETATMFGWRSSRRKRSSRMMR
eukprot:COSAG04_NODE_28576_length_274_cov_2.062857_1_plen_35_part_10